MPATHHHQKCKFNINVTSFRLLLIYVLLGIDCINAPLAHAAPTSQSLRDTCGHTLVRPNSFFKRHFDYAFLKKFFMHLIPFVHVPRVKMQFYLYKRDFAECGREIITDDDVTLDMSDFNADHPTRIIIHGWMSQSKGSLNRAVKNAYLSLSKRNITVELPTNDTSTEVDLETSIKTTTSDSDFNLRRRFEDYNIIVVDWSKISSNANYFSVVELIEDLGALLANFVQFLHTRRGLHYDDVYLIGHSLGAQIAGAAGKRAHPFRYNTIFALDPAGPSFHDRSVDYRIDRTDASYVESILTSSSLGFQDPVGHATFYPNYGKDQKKCYIYGCSHSRAYDYFAESITSDRGFWGTLCRRESKDVWILSDSGAEFRMGGEPSSPKRGTYYVKTAAKPPYALGRQHRERNSVKVIEAVKNHSEIGL